MAIVLRLNDALDPALLAEEYRQHGRLQIHQFLSPDSAGALLNAFRANTTWFLSYNEGDDNVETPLSEIERLSPAQRQQFFSAINLRARTQFQYCFVQYYISEAVKRGEQPGHPLHCLQDFLNCPEFLELMRTVTAEPAICRTDALASVYSPGHFLTDHDDRHAVHKRVAAYVLNLTKSWNRNWGGHLAFFDAAGNIEQAFVPCFNTLNIFRVPQSHAVQPIAAYAGNPRFSVTGWLHRAA